LEQILANPPTVSTDILVTDGQGQNSFYRLFNRIVDYGFALTVMVCLCWLFVGVWLAIRLTSEGRAVFAQLRVGREGQTFVCYKFRTMQVGTRQAATHEMTGDAITPAGRWMRRLKLDELPQAWNILRGDMSLIGPRPCLPSQHALIDWRNRLGVLQVRPGITGLAQVRGVDMSDPERLARLDAEYIARRSVFLDFRIILATARGSGSRDYVAKN
jgi:lipopolysaccharide/colanic/teichoic acid biosynthesis glycosyltransferase